MVIRFLRIIEKCPFIFLCLFAVLVCAPMFINGLHMIASYAHNLLLHEGFSSQLLSGTLYPRWFPELYNGYGGASGFYYPPLLFWFSGLIDFISMNILSSEQALMCVVYLALVLSGWCFYLFIRGYCNLRYSLALASLYMIMPYHFTSEILFRNAIAEFLAYIWIPVIFLCLRKDMFKQRRYIFGYCIAYAALILSHLPTALLTSAFIGAYSIFIVWPDKHGGVHFISRVILLSIISIGLACVYLFPAITMLDYMNLDALKYYDIHSAFIDNFNTAKDRGYSITIFSLAVVPLIISILVFASSYAKSFHGSRRTITFLCLLNFVVFFMMTSYSSVIWQNVPFISSIQFPWRLLVLSDFFTLFLIACYLRNENNAESKNQMLIALFSYCIIMYSFAHIATYYKTPDSSTIARDIQIAQLKNKAPNPEHIPKNDVYTPPPYPTDIRIETRDIVSIVSGDGSVLLIDHKPRQAILRIDNPSALVDVEFRQFMFYNWRLKDLHSGQDVTEAYALRAAAPYGQMQFSVPAGRHEIQITLEKNIYEYIGEALSAISLCILLLWLLTANGRKKNYKPVKHLYIIPFFKFYPGAFFNA